MASVDTVNASSSSLPFNNVFSEDRKKYDVFLSFRGSDTRNNFTDLLFAGMNQKGISTFRDAERFERGKSIAEELFIAIEEAKFAVVILSRNYASSRWCLAEVTKIVECMEKKKLIVLPIFHYVDPHDVRNQRGAFADAFAKHEERFKDSTEVVSLWRYALTKVANIPGWVLNYGDPESQLIDEFIESLCNLSNQMPEDGSTNWDLPPRFDDSPDEADDDADEMVQDYVADLPLEAHVVPDDVADVPQEAHVVEDHVANLPQECAICVTNARGMAFLCGHTTCVECGERLDRCPICRERIIYRIRLFLE
ncbi:TMV resistance protein N-like isoform X2 [Quercus robur]|uniref:TMV resistance protein N-like isoform X2 n=1 Tax=Quercus robur TaxID=38942 RepID=UPI002163EBB1|nr:TMV resistance protein N-like isoform X2 [Quercus robur]